MYYLIESSSGTIIPMVQISKLGGDPKEHGEVLGSETGTAAVLMSRSLDPVGTP